MFEKAMRMIQEGQLDGIPGVKIGKQSVRFIGYSDEETEALANSLADAMTDALN